jgi:hypothetical protein
MVRHKDVIDNCHHHQSLRAIPGQRRIGRKKDRKATNSNQQWKDNEPDRLRSQQRAIRFSAINKEVRTGRAMAYQNTAVRPK